MKQVSLFPGLLPDDEDGEPVETRPVPRPRPRSRWQPPPELFPEHAEAIRRRREAAMRAARIAADRSAEGCSGRRPMVHNPVSAVICVVRREVWGSRAQLASISDIPVVWIKRLEQEPWSGRVIDELAFERRRSRRLRRFLGLSVVELLDLEEERLELEHALENALERAREHKARQG